MCVAYLQELAALDKAVAAAGQANSRPRYQQPARKQPQLQLRLKSTTSTGLVSPTGKHCPGTMKMALIAVRLAMPAGPMCLAVAQMHVASPGTWQAIIKLACSFLMRERSCNSWKRAT